MIPDLYLIRHGESLWNAEGRIQGRLDSPLTPQGRAQAEALAPLVAGLGARRLSSPQGRAQETARLLWGADFATDARLAEIDIGTFGGRLIDELRDEHPAAFAPPWLGWYDRAPGGEGWTGLRARCAGFLAALDGPTVAVTHGITLRMLRLLAMDRPLSALEELRVEQGAIHVIRAGRHEVWRP